MSVRCGNPVCANCTKCGWIGSVYVKAVSAKNVTDLRIFCTPCEQQLSDLGNLENWTLFAKLDLLKQNPARVVESREEWEAKGYTFTSPVRKHLDTIEEMVGWAS
jgi:hypothetical protein